MKAQNATILIVEDDPNDQFLIQTTLKKVGVVVPVHIVSSGMEAIAYMEGQGKFADREQFRYPTLIMTDLKMSDGDGFSVLENLKKRPEWAIIPTIVFSASSDLDDIKQSYLLGASAYHVKPQTSDAFRALLKLLCDYWSTSEVPLVDPTGKQLPTDSRGKMGERFG